MELKKIKDQPVGGATRQSCSSFIATGNWTKGGNVVLGHPSPIPSPAIASILLSTWEATQVLSDYNQARAGGLASARRFPRTDQEPEPRARWPLDKESWRQFGGPFPNSRPKPPAPWPPERSCHLASLPTP